MSQTPPFQEPQGQVWRRLEDGNLHLMRTPTATPTPKAAPTPAPTQAPAQTPVSAQTPVGTSRWEDVSPLLVEARVSVPFADFPSSMSHTFRVRSSDPETA